MVAVSIIFSQTTIGWSLRSLGLWSVKVESFDCAENFADIVIGCILVPSSFHSSPADLANATISFFLAKSNGLMVLL